MAIGSVLDLDLGTIATEMAIGGAQLMAFYKRIRSEVVIEEQWPSNRSKMGT